MRGFKAGAVQRATVRRRKPIWPWIPAGIVGLLLILLALPFLLVRAPGPRDWMLDQGLGSLLPQGVRLRIGAVERLDPWGADLTGIVLACRDSSGRWRPWAELSRLRAEWDVGGLAVGRYEFRSVVLETLAVDARPELAPPWRRARAVTPRVGGGAGEIAGFSCRRLILEHGMVHRGGEPAATLSAALTGLELERGALWIDVDSLALAAGSSAWSPLARAGTLAVARGSAKLDLQGEVHLDDLRWRGFGAAGQAWVARDSSGWSASLQLARAEPAAALEHFNWTLPRRYRPAAGDTLNGFLTLYALSDTLEAACDLSGSWAGRPLQAAGVARRVRS
ncbi:MAG: hypothetical protein GF355_14625, partial [Candidatus Eisenbacteria bacterium]|nr:hypothetical protein [Candidatus Eisenbacteria bacterium]